MISKFHFVEKLCFQIYNTQNFTVFKTVEKGFFYFKSFCFQQNLHFYKKFKLSEQSAFLRRSKFIFVFLCHTCTLKQYSKDEFV